MPEHNKQNFRGLQSTRNLIEIRDLRAYLQSYRPATQRSEQSTHFNLEEVFPLVLPAGQVPTASVIFALLSI